jgi:hypothetical protein
MSTDTISVPFWYTRHLAVPLLTHSQARLLSDLWSNGPAGPTMKYEDFLSPLGFRSIEMVKKTVRELRAWPWPIITDQVDIYAKPKAVRRPLLLSFADECASDNLSAAILVCIGHVKRMSFIDLLEALQHTGFSPEAVEARLRDIASMPDYTHIEGVFPSATIVALNRTAAERPFHLLIVGDIPIDSRFFYR